MKNSRNQYLAPRVKGRERKMKDLLKKARIEIEKEMAETGFIDESDNIERFLDKLATELVDGDESETCNMSDEAESLLEEIKEKIMSKYHYIGENDDRGNHTGFYTAKKFSSLQEFFDYYHLGE
jgi:hypothetical protein